MNNFENEHELFEDDSNGEQILDDTMFEEVENEEDYFDAFDDANALASAGWGTDEDYGYYGSDDY